MLPDVVGLLGLATSPRTCRRATCDGGHDAEHLANEVVVRDQLVDAPQQQAVGVGLAAAAGERAAERRRAEMRVDVDQRLAGDDLADQFFELRFEVRVRDDRSFDIGRGTDRVDMVRTRGLAEEKCTAGANAGTISHFRPPRDFANRRRFRRRMSWIFATASADRLCLEIAG